MQRGEKHHASEAEAQIILSTLEQLIEPLAALIPGECEVVLHDLSRLPNSIVGVAGDLTGRSVGGAATDLLLRAEASGNYATSLGYSGRSAEGNELRSSTMIFRDSHGSPVAAVCINNDTAAWEIVLDLAQSMMPWTKPGMALEESEELLGDVDDVANHVLASAIKSIGIPVDLMQKRHKVAVVRALKEGGFFLLKESAETAAAALGVTRFSIYNYLNEIEEGVDPGTELKLG